MSDTVLDGGCTCRHVRYRMTTRPLIVHCCHCRWCQRETGSAFAFNALIEADRVRLLHGGAGQTEVTRSGGPCRRDQSVPRSSALTTPWYSGWRRMKFSAYGQVGITARRRPRTSSSTRRTSSAP
jgi:hypothetical protein